MVADKAGATVTDTEAVCGLAAVPSAFLYAQPLTLGRVTLKSLVPPDSASNTAWLNAKLPLQATLWPTSRVWLLA